MHPRIEFLTKLLKDYNPKTLLHVGTLLFFKENGATATEVVITLHLGFGIQDTDAERFVYDSDVWEQENVNDIFDQTLIYLFYNPDDPNYKVNSKEITIPFNLTNKKNQ